jgi:putative addiction module component (TIGR02574 family)
MSQVQDLFVRALELPEPQRAALAHELLLSLESEPFDTDWEAAWGAELDARLAEADAPDSSAQDWREAIAEMRQALPKRPSA